MTEAISCVGGVPKCVRTNNACARDVVNCELGVGWPMGLANVYL